MVENRPRLLPATHFRKNAVLFIIGFILFASVIAYAVYETKKATVIVFIDEEEITVQTHASTVAELMREQEWDVQDYDRVIPSLDTGITGNMHVTWDMAKQIFVTIQGQEESVWTTSESVEQLIHELNIDYKEEDLIEPALNKEITDEMSIVYEAAFQVNLSSNGEQNELWTTSTTVADFLKNKSVSLGELDRVEPDLQTQLDEKTDIQVIRGEKVTDVVEEEVAFGTVTRKDKDLMSGKESVVQNGEPGLVNNFFEVVLEDGVEVSRKHIKTETVKESTDKVVAVGTRPTATSVSRSKAPTKVAQAAQSGGRTLTVSATAYTAQCHGCSGVTATGINLNTNRNMKVIAVDPNVIPLGSRVHVEGYGTAIAGDTGGAIRGNKIDIHVPTKADAQRWGRKQVNITILD